jgi:hypothetical protein
LALGEPAGVGQLLGVAAVLLGIAMSTTPPGSVASRMPVLRRLTRPGLADLASRVLRTH